MARRSKQLKEEIEASLAAGTPHPEATVADWKKRIAAIQATSRRTSDRSAREDLQRQLTAASDGLRAAQRVTGHQATYVTGTNLFALKELVITHGGPNLPVRLDAVDAPHIRRTLDAGLVEAVGNRLHLTSAGRAAVADLLVQDIERERAHVPRVNTFVPADKRDEILKRDVDEHQEKIDRLERTLAKISEG